MALPELNFLNFDPFSAFKYHATFWNHCERKDKMMAAAVVACTMISLLAARYFIFNNTNMILSNRVSGYADSALLLAGTYTLITCIVGFVARTFIKHKHSELINKLLQESNARKYVTLPEQLPRAENGDLIG